MSLEAALAANTAALERHSDALDALIKAGGSSTGKGAGKPKPGGKRGGKKTKPWADETAYLEAFGGYLKGAETKPERKRVRATVGPILDHFGVEKISEIGEDDREEAYGYLQLLIAGWEEGELEGAEAVDLELGNEGDGDDSDVL